MINQSHKAKYSLEEQGMKLGGGGKKGGIKIKEGFFY